MYANTGGNRRSNTEYITHYTTRRNTFRKRKASLLKKLKEITTLCDVKGCAVIINPDNVGEVDIFPAYDTPAVTKMIIDFEKMSKEDQSRKMFTQETFLAEKIQKVKEQAQKIANENRYTWLSNLFKEHLNDRTKSFNGLTVWDVRDLGRMCATYHWLNDRKIISNDETENNLELSPQHFNQNMAGIEAMIGPGFMNQGNNFPGLVPSMPGFSYLTTQQLINQNIAGTEAMVGPGFLNQVPTMSGFFNPITQQLFNPNMARAETMIGPGFMNQVPTMSGFFIPTTQQLNQNMAGTEAMIGPGFLNPTTQQLNQNMAGTEAMIGPVFLNHATQQLNQNMIGTEAMIGHPGFLNPTTQQLNQNMTGTEAMIGHPGFLNPTTQQLNQNMIGTEAMIGPGFFNPTTQQLNQNMTETDAMVGPGFMNQGNNLGPVTANETDDEYPAWYINMMSQNGGVGCSKMAGSESSSNSLSN